MKHYNADNLRCLRKKKYKPLPSVTPPSTIAENRPWLVLLATSPARTEYRLRKENMQQEQRGEADSCFRFFVPYTAMEAGEAASDQSPSGFSLRSALRRYLFVKGREGRLKELMTVWNKSFDDKLFFLKDGSKHIARIKQSDMDKLRKACLCDASQFDTSVALGNVQPGQKISLVNTPFESDDCEYEVVSVRRKAAGTIELQVKMVMFGIEFDNITVTYNDTADSDSNASLVSSTQKRLLDIFRRRVNRKETPVTEYEDQKTLNDIFSHRDTIFPEGAMKRHFLALMLICSHLLGDEQGVVHFRESVEKELAVISRVRESKAATDTRAYLHIALYIATGEARYRDQAKTYVRKYAPSSPYLRQFVTTMSKREASKFLGTKARKKA